jgi:N-methylhydantoinase B
MDELEHPIRVETRRLMIDSEGAGRFRGAPGLLVEFSPIGTALEIGYVSDGTVNPAQGARGGGAGGRARQALRRADGRVEELPPCAQITAAPGETIISLSTGGGGYGDPKQRDPERVRHDVREKWISAERAREIYGLAD